MRNEQEMFDLILKIAIDDVRIRGVYLSGSRANPNVPKDIFQDFDVVYIVKETAPFYKDKKWIDIFGERLYMQYPDESAYCLSDIDNCYGWLMQFLDGNRLDLHVCTLSYLPKSISGDKMYKVLLDKDGCLPDKDIECDEAFRIKNFTEKEFLCSCNEFWWCMNNVAKGLWRAEILYVLDMLNFNIRPMLTRILEYKIGIETNFSISVGKSSKYMNKWLSNDIWYRYLQTYSDANVDDIWSSVFIMCDLFNEISQEVSVKTGFMYDIIEAKNSRNYLSHVQKLPKNAKEVY